MNAAGGNHTTFPSSSQRCLKTIRMKKLPKCVQCLLFPRLALREAPPAHILTGPPSQSSAPGRETPGHPPHTVAPWTSATSTSPTVTGEDRPHSRGASLSRHGCLEAAKGESFPLEWKGDSCEPSWKSVEVAMKASCFLSTPAGSLLHWSPPHSVKKQGSLQFALQGFICYFNLCPHPRRLPPKENSTQGGFHHLGEWGTQLKGKASREGHRVLIMNFIVMIIKWYLLYR